MKNQTNNRAFTLLELSIVLIIIAVVVAGVLVGRTMVASSQLQTVMTDASNYIAAVGNFKNTYQALPGDFANAEASWGTDSNGCPNGAGATGTCNGNGDGKIGPSCVNGTMSWTYQNESFRAWQQLADAGLISNSLLPAQVNGLGTATYAMTPDITIPKSSIKGAGWNLMWLDPNTPSNNCTSYWGLLQNTGTYGNSLVLTSGPSFGSVITPEQAQAIDSKMDDGLPFTGTIRVPYTPNASCTVSGTPYTYNVGSGQALCSLIFLTGY